jgi:HEAT repeat protein
LGQSLAHEAEPLVRGHCAWALGRFSQLAAREHLNHALQRETDSYVRSEILAALRGLSAQGSQEGSAASSEIV